jgi:hypothetical protein
LRYSKLASGQDALQIFHRLGTSGHRPLIALRDHA